MHKPKPHGTKTGGYKIFVPNADGQLRSVEVKDRPIGLSTTNDANAYMTSTAFVMKHLLAEAPAEFPAGTRLLGVKVDETKKVASVDLSKEFTTAGFWQGSTRTLATVYAVVNTVAAVNPKTANKVQILVEGKPIDLLGEFDASEPLEPDNKLVASS